MSRIKQLSITTICVFSLLFNGLAQNLETSKKVYYTPLSDIIYLAIDVNPMNTEQFKITKNGTFSHYQKNDLLPINADSLKEYKANENYSNGEYLKIKVSDFTNEKPQPTYSIIKIIGKIETAALNSQVLTEAEKLFGKGNVLPWPNNMYESKLSAKVPNEKDIDCDYYIKTSFSNINAQLADWYFKEDRIQKGDSDNLVVFYAAVGMNQNIVSEVPSRGYRYLNISIREKKMEGKKGKVIYKANSSDLFSADKLSQEKEEFRFDLLKPEQYSKYGLIPTLWTKLDGYSGKLIESNTNLFLDKTSQTISELFQL